MATVINVRHRFVIGEISPALSKKVHDATFEAYARFRDNGATHAELVATFHNYNLSDMDTLYNELLTQEQGDDPRR